MKQVAPFKSANYLLRATTNAYEPFAVDWKQVCDAEGRVGHIKLLTSNTAQSLLERAQEFQRDLVAEWDDLLEYLSSRTSCCR